MAMAKNNVTVKKVLERLTSQREPPKNSESVCIARTYIYKQVRPSRLIAGAALSLLSNLLSVLSHCSGYASASRNSRKID